MAAGASLTAVWHWLPSAFAHVYKVSATEFYVEVAVPTSLMKQDLSLVVSVWGRNPSYEKSALGSECVNNSRVAGSVRPGSRQAVHYIGQGAICI